MIHAVCYLFGKNDTPTLHGTITFRSVTHNRIGIDVDLYGIKDARLYGLCVGEMLLPPMLADEQGSIQMTFYRNFPCCTNLFGCTVSVFRYNLAVQPEKPKHQTIAVGTVHQIAQGSLAYDKDRWNR